MDSRSKTARLAGLIYLITVATGLISLMYVPSQISGNGDAVATVNNIAGFDWLFRLGVVAESLQYLFFLLLGLVLYRLLGPVNRNAAVLMVALVAVAVPMGFLAVANKLDVLSLLHGNVHRALLAPDQLHARVLFSIDAYYNRILVSELFWGLWLFPFGYLVFRSGFLPKALGILLMAGCFSYLVTFFGQTLLPRHTIPDFVMWPVAIAEIASCLWLLVVGARPVGSTTK